MEATISSKMSGSMCCMVLQPTRLYPSQSALQDPQAQQADFCFNCKTAVLNQTYEYATHHILLNTGSNETKIPSDNFFSS